MESEELGLPVSFVAQNMGTKIPSRTSLLEAARSKSYEKQLSSLGSFAQRRKSNSLSNLSQTPRTLSSSSLSSSSPVNTIPLIKGVLRPSKSLPLLAYGSKTSLTSIPEGDEGLEDSENDENDSSLGPNHASNEKEYTEDQGKNLHWGGVDIYCPNDDSDSRASSGKTDVDSLEEDEEEEEDGWGWYESEANTGMQIERERRSSRSDSAQQEVPQKVQRESKPLVRVVSQSTPLDPATDPKYLARTATSSAARPVGGGSLLLLGSDQWPERRTRRRRTSRKNDFVAQDIPEASDEETNSNYLLESLVLETRSKGFPLSMSAFLVFSRGAATGFALRAIPSYVLRLVLWFYGEKASSNIRDSLRSGLFLGLSMATYHVMAMKNVAVEKDESEEIEESEENALGENSWIPVTAAIMTPLLFILPEKSRLSMSLFVAARATESIINGLMFRLSRNFREQLPVSKWLFALGSAQIVFTWLFHRAALPSELATFLDKASSYRPDERLVELLQSPNKATYDEAIKTIQVVSPFSGGESIVKRFLLGSGLIELMASDVFSAASLFGPVFAFPHEFESSLRRGLRSAAVLVMDAMLSGVALIGLTKLLRRVAPSNGWWAGFVAGLIAVQAEGVESRQVEIALFALTYAVRALYNLAAIRQVVPPRVQHGEFALYFVSLCVVLKAATIAPVKRLSHTEELHRRKKHKHMLVLGSTFRTMIKRCIIPG